MTTSPYSSAPAPTTAIAGQSGVDLSTQQFNNGDLGLLAGEYKDVCGAIAIQAFLRHAGREIPLPDIVDKSKNIKTPSGGPAFSDENGLAYGGMDALADAYGISLFNAGREGGTDALKAGQTIGVHMPSSSSFSGHYMVAQGIDEQGRMLFGHTASSVFGTGAWATPEEVANAAGTSASNFEYYTATIAPSTSGRSATYGKTLGIDNPALPKEDTNSYYIPRNTTSSSSIFKKPIVTQDTGKDITALIEKEAAANNISPRALAAVLYAESNFNEYSTRGWNEETKTVTEPWPDVSFGLGQMTVETAGLLHVGTGENTTENIETVRNYLFQAENSVRVSASALGWATQTSINEGGAGGAKDAWLVYNYGHTPSGNESDYAAHSAHIQDSIDYIEANYHSGTRSAKEGIAVVEEGEMIFSQNQASMSDNSHTMHVTFSPLILRIDKPYQQARLVI